MNNIFIAGHNGMVGSAILKSLRQNKTKLFFENKEKLDLTNKNMVKEYFEENDINKIFLCAAKVGGIKANNSFPANFLYENLMIQSNVIDTAYKLNIKKLLFLGSSCIYPKKAKQPLKESYLLDGKLEKTNEAYAIAKISGLKMCEYYSKQYGVDFRTVMPTNLYGPEDNFNTESSHVIPGLIKKFHEAKVNSKSSVTLWGTGNPKREFLYVDDMADACCFVMNLEKEKYNKICGDNEKFMNIGYGEDISIHDLSLIISDIVGYSGEILFNLSDLDGTQRKLLDSSKINSLGWKPKTSLKKGLKKTYKWFLKNI
jgi:GDP-L-fucose synthase